jgi:hypothetical protein
MMESSAAIAVSSILEGLLVVLAATPMSTVERRTAITYIRAPLKSAFSVESLMKRAVVALGLVLSLTSVVNASEGFWQPHQLPLIEKAMHAAGIAVDPKELADPSRYPLNAVVSLGGYCTASFVSPLGLLVSNHHCALGSIQYLSSVERNLITSGFLAQTLGEELPAEPGLRIFITESITDVTEHLLGKLNDQQSDRERFDALDRGRKALVADCEATPGYRCEVYEFDAGARYQLVKQLEIRDLRLVYTPASAIGRFGGEVDNWRWPRLTGDFAFYRAYVGPDGKSADFSEANVPYRPQSHLKLQPAGLKTGDFVMMPGYPGRTHRYRLASELKQTIDWQYPYLIEHYAALLSLIAEQTRERPEAALRYAGTVGALNNRLAQFRGMLTGLAAADALTLKTAEEQRISKWAAEHQELAGLAGRNAIQQQNMQAQSTRATEQLLRMLDNVSLYAAARDLYRLAGEREKPDSRRERGYQGRDEARIRAGLERMDRRYDAGVDRAMLGYLLQGLISLPAEQRIPELDRWVAGESGEANAAGLAERLDALFAGTRIGSAEQRMSWFKADRKALEAATDPALVLARTLFPATLRIANAGKTAQGRDEHDRGAWMATRAAYARAHGRELYADANSSLRISFGKVQGESSGAGGFASAFTGLDDLLARHTGVEPFDATPKQLAAITDKHLGQFAVDGSVQVNFLADLDLSSGSSGSPILNARAELVGLAFDGNQAAISSSWLFTPGQTRAIAVDVRYMLWLMEVVDGAQRLLEEMAVTPAASVQPTPELPAPSP